MLRKILLAGLILFLCNTVLSLFSSCEPEDEVIPEGGGGNYCAQKCYQSDSIWVTGYNIGGEANIQSGSLNTATNVRLDVHLRGKTIICHSNKLQKHLNFSLFAKAYASTPPICNYIPYGNDSIVAYNIYSNQNYNSSHPAGSSLNDIMDNLSLPLDSVETYYDIEDICSFKINILPADSGSHIFTIDIVQLDGDTIRASTPAIRLKKP